MRLIGWRGFITCLFACVVMVGPTKAQPHGRYNQNQQQDESARSYQPTGPSSPANQPQIKTYSIETPCRNPRNNSDADLCQQWRVAEATEDIWALTLAQIVLSVFGIVGLLVTIAFTKKAVSAAIEANALARDTSKQELRAYVGVTDGGVTLLGKEGETIGLVVIKNAGQTPAHNLLFYGRMKVGSLEKPILEDVPNINDRVNDSRSALFPGQSVSRHISLELTEAVLKEVQGGTRAIHVWGRVNYTDVFGSSQATDFRYFVTGPEVQFDRNSPEARGWTFTPHSSGNDAT